MVANALIAVGGFLVLLLVQYCRCSRASRCRSASRC
jgi:hypothetical protein